MRFIAGLLAAGIGFAPLSGVAEGLSGERDFSFKRVKVGEGVGKRKIVQIDPAEQARLLALAPKVIPREPTPEPDAVTAVAGAVAAPGALAKVAPKSSSYDWFWQTVPTSRGAVADRFPLAMATLSKGPKGTGVTAPRLQHMQGIAEQYGKHILAATIGTDVSPALVLAVIGVESSGRADAVSHAGAQGLMQLIPATASRFGVTDSTDPAQNIKGGVAYLNWLLKEFNRDPLMVLAAYNAGEGAVRANDGIPPYAETRDYVPKVLAAWQVSQGLCLTPPELVTDPCVFKVISAGG
ncbi:MAG: lytic transglycosylase domain-containing protein [Pseudotabrizicola sp.]|uniref:lytic transglycosylase domain-containing protein n=1 Tax=Pseudotabrizicola sp. TaxID=2939647 RepID=UPI00273092B5|nr:lytic transglycosylase domain-containing protein [Pseudotabrizicola sp.]MDP2081650.1 lytic transglycosylase domain-containing protein [Pseudotabrizicola sp.]MDZ7574000.1 lytic transglycosylase domain-containing protein [Pseudotabrizicola sp.]